MGSFAAALDPCEQTAALLGCLVEARKCREQPAHMVVNSVEGMEVHVVNRSKSAMSRLKLPCASFLNFMVRDESGCEESSESIRLSLDAVALVECLQLLGSHYNEERAITLSYEASEAILKLTLEEFGVFTSCDLAALDMEIDIETAQDMRNAFRGSPIVAEIIASSKILKELVLDLDDNTATLLRITLFPAKLCLSLTTATGTIEVEAPSTLFVKFKATVSNDSSCTFVYRKDAFNRGMTALAYATDTYLSINQEGILRLQHIVATKANNRDHVFLEYICASSTGAGLTQDDEAATTGQNRAVPPSCSSSDDEALLPAPKRRFFGHPTLARQAQESTPSSNNATFSSEEDHDRNPNYHSTNTHQGAASSPSFMSPEY